jgi:flagellar biosynthesis/type III secretory pathway M-ring protein FliF/YscJ
MLSVFSGWVWHPAFWFIIAAFILAKLIMMVYHRKRLKRKQRLWEEYRARILYAQVQQAIERMEKVTRKKALPPPPKEKSLHQWLREYIEQNPEKFSKTS